MAFANFTRLGTAHEDGRTLTSTFRKAPSQISVAGWWTDLSMTSGNPPPNYYAASPLEAATLVARRGIWHGEDKSPSQKYLMKLQLASPAAAFTGMVRLLDYLMYYPFVDLDDTADQVFVNDVELPRYAVGADGAEDGVLPMLVAVTPTTGLGVFNFDYVNQDGVARTAPSQNCSQAAANIGALITSEPATIAGGRPFLLLADGDTSCRRITAWRNTTSNGGLGALVLVKTLATHIYPEATSVSEVSFVHEQPPMPRIRDGAYLNLIHLCTGSVAAQTLTGRADFCWD